MFDHLILLIFLIILFFNFWIILYLKQVHNSFPDKAIKAIILYSYWYIILSGLQFLYFYLIYNLDIAEIDTLLSFLMFCINFASIFRVFLVFNIFLNFREISIKKSHKMWFILASAFIIISYFIKSFIPETQLLFFWTDYISNSLIIMFKSSIYFEFLILISFYFWEWKSKINNSRIKIYKTSILYYITTQVIPMFIFSNIFTLYTNQQIQLWVIIFSLKIIYILSITIWIKFIYLAYAQNIPNVIKKNDKFKLIYTQYKISKRETEIIELLIDGKTSNEIKEDLFISYHTVKNHISHIYKKLNVKSRYELVKFFKKLH